MKNSLSLILFAILLQCTHKQNGDTATSLEHIKITENVTNEQFGGIGFHVFYHQHNASRDHYEQVFAKRWRELSPSFARITDSPNWDKERMDKVATYLDVMKGTDTELYFTTWGTHAIKNYDDEMDYVRHEVDNLEYMKNEKGFKNLKYFCMTNELSLESWASLVDNLDYFKQVQQQFYDEINRRSLNIDLLATDASPISNWHTIEWAANNMDDITGIYGGHHYINSYDLLDNSFYPFFLDKIQWGTGIAKGKGKGFIIGEFGPKQSSNFIDSVKHDACMYNNMPLETYVGIQVSEAIMAMINGGVYAASYWTFCDFPTKYNGKYVNKWGVFKWEIDDYTTRPSYYALGLITKYFRGPSKVFEVHTSDELLRSCAVINTKTNAISIAVINRHDEEKTFVLDLEAATSGISMRKYVYDPENVPFNYFGDLQTPEKKILLGEEVVKDIIPAQSLVVYTSQFDEDPPAAVAGVRVTNKELEGRPRTVVSWKENVESDFCYYRIYRAEKEDFDIAPRRQVATTISTEYVDRSVHGMQPYYYKVVAVDQSGNSSE